MSWNNNGGGFGGGGRGGGRGGYGGGHNNDGQRSRLGPASKSNFTEGSWLCKFLFSDKVTGAVIGKGGTKINQIRDACASKVKWDGDNFPERIMTILSPSKEQVVQAINMSLEFIHEDFGSEQRGRRPPMVLHPNQRRLHFGEEDYQICFILSENHCGKIVGQKGATIRELESNHGVYVNVFREFPGGASYLPNSNERVISITGNYKSIPNCLHEMLNLLQDQREDRQGKAWDISVDGAANFYEMAEGGSGRGGRGGGGNDFGNNMTFGGNSYAGNAMPGMDVFVQILEVEMMNDDKNAQISVNSEQAGTIIGNGGHRINEIRSLSNAQIKIHEPEGNSCFRCVEISSRNGSPEPVQKAIWLMNVCINAFVDPVASVAPFDKSCSMEEVMASGKYPMPGQAALQDPMANFNTQPAPASGFGAAPSRAGGMPNMSANPGGMMNNMMQNQMSMMQNMMNQMQNTMQNAVAGQKAGNFGTAPPSGMNFGSVGNFNGGGAGGNNPWTAESNPSSGAW